MFTDGDDSASKLGIDDVHGAGARERHAWSTRSGCRASTSTARRVRTRPDRGLKKIAEETGGGFFELTKKDDLGPTFTRVAQELHSQYTLGFSPATLDGKMHKLEVRVKRAGMTARAARAMSPHLPFRPLAFDGECWSDDSVTW